MSFSSLALQHHRRHRHRVRRDPVEQGSRCADDSGCCRRSVRGRHAVGRGSRHQRQCCEGSGDQRDRRASTCTVARSVSRRSATAPTRPAPWRRNPPITLAEAERIARLPEIAAVTSHIGAERKFKYKDKRVAQRRSRRIQRGLARRRGRRHHRGPRLHVRREHDGRERRRDQRQDGRATVQGLRPAGQGDRDRRQAVQGHRPLSQRGELSREAVVVVGWQAIRRPSIPLQTGKRHLGFCSAPSRPHGQAARWMSRDRGDRRGHRAHARNSGDFARARRTISRSSPPMG